MFESCRAHQINNLQPLISRVEAVVNNFVRDRLAAPPAPAPQVTEMAKFLPATT
jgi:hypothetical protein